MTFRSTDEAGESTPPFESSSDASPNRHRSMSSARARGRSGTGGSDERGHLRPFRPHFRGSLGIVRKHPKVRVLEPRSHRASGEYIVGERPRCLPMPCPDRADRRARAGAEWAEAMPEEIATRVAPLEELEWSTLVQMPDLVRGHLVPPAVRALRQEEVDGRQRSA